MHSLLLLLLVMLLQLRLLLTMLPQPLRKLKRPPLQLLLLHPMVVNQQLCLLCKLKTMLILQLPLLQTHRWLLMISPQRKLQLPRLWKPRTLLLPELLLMKPHKLLWTLRQLLKMLLPLVMPLLLKMLQMLLKKLL